MAILFFLKLNFELVLRSAYANASGFVEVVGS